MMEQEFPSPTGKPTAAMPRARQPLFRLLCSLLFWLPPLPAWAVQGHGDPEGLVAHLIGHLLFVTAVLFLLYHSHHRCDLPGRGWRCFRLFLWCILAWNIQTASGHILREIVPAERFIGGGHPTAFQITGLQDAWFYFTRLDHLLMVPALALLLAALWHWRKEP